MDINKVKITETEEYERLVEFFVDNGLEFSVDDDVPTDLVMLWKAETPDGKLVGGCVLALREGEYIIDGIAVDPQIRALKLGKELLGLAEKEMYERGGRQMYLVARAPEFFRKQGFVTVKRDEAPNFFECFTCPQYNVSCHPEVMKFES